jgi:hypothetical protein
MRQRGFEREGQKEKKRKKPTKKKRGQDKTLPIQFSSHFDV